MKSFLLQVLLLNGFLAVAQPVTKLYAYSQVITPGMVRQRDIPAEKGESEEKKSLAAVQYYIYAAIKTGETPQFRQVWIKGRWYSIRRTTVVKPPVSSPSANPVVLVPATRQKIVQIEQGESGVSPRIFPALERMMKNAALILCYSWKGKLYYIPLRRIPELEKVHAE